MEDVTPERWLPAPAWEGYYEVSDLGRVRSIPHETEMGLRGGHVLKPGTYTSGHKHVTFTRTTDAGKDRETFQVHRLVMLTFAGPDSRQVRHLDGDPANNRWAPGSTEEEIRAASGNLIYGTPAENAHDRDEVHGRNFHSNKTHCPQKHEYNEQNTYWYQGHRYCIPCRDGGRPALECDEPGCPNRAKTRGLCNKHLQRWYRSQRSPEKREQDRAKGREYQRQRRLERQNGALILIQDTLF